ASLEYPHNIIIVDEVAFLTAYVDDRKIRDAINGKLSTLSTQGRSVGFTLIAALQDPRKEVLKIRNLFPDKIALRLDESEQVDMVLGDGARDRGALADLITTDESEGAGIGYVRLEKSPIPIRGRAGYVCDADITAMVRDYGTEVG
ncbi:cell division protein FtsK, partial [Planobispora takensis]